MAEHAGLEAAVDSDALQFRAEAVRHGDGGRIFEGDEDEAANEPIVDG